MEIPYVTNIQKYSIHDGDGIRTTIFFKGCPLKCSWCHNPETQTYEKELMYDSEKCTCCQECLKICPQKAVTFKEGFILTDKELCNACGKCSDYCLQNVRDITGKKYSLAELVDEAVKDQLFYEESGGGVTLSGGEVMSMDKEYIEKLVKELYMRGISVNIDTCGFASYENFKNILPYIDVFLYDLKLMNNELHKKYTGADNNLILENLQRLYEDGAKIYIRMPIIEGVNAEEQHIKAIITYLTVNNIKPIKINLLPYHNTGKSKYYKLQKIYDGENLLVPADDKLQKYVALFNKAGFQNVIIGG